VYRSILLALFILTLVLPIAASQTKRPLDLPSGGPGATEDEDTPEVIDFYGSEYEGDGFFFLLDISGSMYGDAMVTLKSEMHSAIDQMSARSDFGIVAYNWQTFIFETVPVKAIPPKKIRAKKWVLGLEPVGRTHMLDGALALLEISKRSKKEFKTCIAVGDGIPSDPTADETLEGILGANQEQLPWNTILIEDNFIRAKAREFMETLSKETRGKFDLASR